MRVFERENECILMFLEALQVLMRWGTIKWVYPNGFVSTPGSYEMGNHKNLNECILMVL